MKLSWSKWVVTVCLCGVLGATWACEGDFNLSISFVTPQRADDTQTQTVALMDDSRVVVDNHNGSTRVTVDPAATAATVEITKVALAEDQDAADELLTKIEVAVTPPSDGDHALRISAPRPDAAADSEGDFHFEVTDDELNVTGVLHSRRVALVKLLITLPPGHAVEVTQKNGAIRAAGLDVASSLSTDNGSVRALNATGDITVRTDNGSVRVEDHRASLDARTHNGSLEINLDSLGASQEIVGRTSNGCIELDVPMDIDAELRAETDHGMIEFDPDDFDAHSDLSYHHHHLAVTLNDGGPSIKLNTDNGWIDIDGR
jgi:hypothetical protein